MFNILFQTRYTDVANSINTILLVVLPFLGHITILTAQYLSLIFTSSAFSQIRPINLLTVFNCNSTFKQYSHKHCCICWSQNVLTFLGRSDANLLFPTLTLVHFKCVYQWSVHYVCCFFIFVNQHFVWQWCLYLWVQKQICNVLRTVVSSGILSDLTLYL